MYSLKATIFYVEFEKRVILTLCTNGFYRSDNYTTAVKLNRPIEKKRSNCFKKRAKLKGTIRCSVNMENAFVNLISTRFDYGEKNTNTRSNKFRINSPFYHMKKNLLKNSFEMGYTDISKFKCLRTLVNS